MSGKLYNEIPNRIIKCLVHASFYTLSKYQRTVLALTNQLQFFEVKSKEIIFAIDLGETKLKELSLSIANVCPSQQYSDGDRGSPSAVESQENQKRNVFDDNVILTSYIYYQGSLKRYFILIKAYDKLVVIEKCTKGFKLISQYNHVDKVEIVDPENTFRPIVLIAFGNSTECLKTTFVDNDTFKNQPSISSSFTNTEMFKQINKKIKDARTELSTQKLYTRQEFIKIKNNATFGPNFIRSSEIEEKQPLRKYGDVWIKVNDPYFVIGIPVINNCSHTLTTLQNIRVVLSCLEKEDLQYEYMLYQLRDDSYTYDNFDELLQSQEKEKYCLKFQEDWLPIQSRVLQPECSGIIAVKGKLSSSLLCRKHNFVCFILYDIKKRSHVFTQQYCVPNIVIDPDVVYKENNQLNFDSNTLYRDLLSVTTTSFCKHLQIEVKAENFYYNLLNFLTNNLGFIALKVENEEPDHMEVDEFDYEISSLSKQPSSDIFYNSNKSGSYWSGTLLRLQGTSKNTISLKIYTKSEAKVSAFVQLLYKDLKEECKILPISCISEVNATKLRHLEDTLRREIQLATKFCKENENNKNLKRSIVYKFQQELFVRELETDLAALDIV